MLKAVFGDFSRRPDQYNYCPARQKSNQEQAASKLENLQKFPIYAAYKINNRWRHEYVQVFGSNFVAI